jgi:23S rRNA (cytosine1962-C5)-methyltransferase
MNPHRQDRPPGPARAPRIEPAAAAVSPWVQLRSVTFHPFIYRRMIGQADPAARPGEVVNVYDKRGALFGRGMFNPRSEIVVRMLTHDDTPIDDAFWTARLSDALALRRTLRLDDVTDAYRLVHAEGDRLSGIVIERYADCLVAEVFALGMSDRAATLLDRLAELLGPPARLDRPDTTAPAWRKIVRADDRAAVLEGFKLPDPPALRTTIREHGVRYRADLSGGHKTGFFCDQRDNRLHFAKLCRDATVLDCCCYTGGFGLCARVVGGAREVSAVDLDEAAVALARENANLNQVRIDTVHADAFAYLRQMKANGRSFDAVVLDPPKLAATRRDLDEALIKYHDLNALACQVVRPGGVFLTCSCSGALDAETFSQTVHRAVRDSGRRLQRLAASGAAPDHPVADDCPETAYLKALWFRVQ